MRNVLSVLLPLFLAALLQFPSLGQNKTIAAADRPLIDKLLNEGWERNSNNRDVLKSWYEQLPGDKSTDVQWAYVLNRLRQNRSRDVNQIIDDLAADSPDDWDVRYTQIWMAAFADETGKAWTLMKRLKSDLLTDATASADIRTETFERLGRLTGYLQGPAKDKTNPAAINTARAELQKNAPPELWQALVAEQDVVLKQFDDLVKQRNAEKTRILDQATRQRTVDLQQQQIELQQIQSDLDRQHDNRNDIIDDGRKEVADLESQIGSLQTELDRLQGEVGGLQFEVGNLWANVYNVNLALRRKRDPYVRGQLAFQASYYANLARDRQAYLGAAQTNADGVYNQLAAANANYNRTRAVYEERVSQATRQIAELERSSRVINHRIKELQKVPSLRTTKLTVIESKANALTTYIPFPADLMKQRMLDALKKSAH